ncbi:MAG: ISAs1 family transposase, partial [Fuerstiella sp.]
MQVLTHDDAVSILEYFDDLDDPRSTINRQHLLGDLIVISVCGVLAGADGPKAIGVWAQAHQDWLQKYLELPNGIPAHDTIGRLLAALKPAAFQSCFERWIDSLRQSSDDKGNEEIIAIDGKALRRSHNHKKSLGPLFLVSAWSVQRGISLGQLATAEKSHEITAIPELLDNIELNKATVTIDAAGCQKNIAAKIIEKGGDYLLALKGNQGNLYQAAMDWVLEQMENDFATTTVRRFAETIKGHGREDTVEYFHMLAPASLPGKSLWKNLRTIGVAIRTSQKGGKETCDVRFFISSLHLGVRRFAKASRGHWGIENSLHWCLDVTFREDESRVRDRLAADNLAWLKRFSISLLKQQDDKESIAMRRRMAGWNVD